MLNSILDRLWSYILRLRKITKMKTSNDGNRTLYESIMMPELVSTLKDWKKIDAKAVLIGGLALSYHVRPRMTQDLDFMFLSSEDIPDKVSGFKRIRPHAFQHNKTHVEIKLITPDFVNVPKKVVQNVFDTSIESDGINISSVSGLVALKLFRLSFQDKADIVALINSGKNIDLTNFELPSEKMNQFYDLVRDAKNDLQPC